MALFDSRIQKEYRIAVEQWGYYHADDDNATWGSKFYRKYIAPFEAGTIPVEDLEYLFHYYFESHWGDSDADRGRKKLLPMLSSLLSHTRTIAAFLAPWDPDKVRWLYSFTYPTAFALSDNCDWNIRSHYACPTLIKYLNALSQIQQLDEGGKSTIKAHVLDTATRAPFETVFMVCRGQGWLEDLEKVWRGQDRFVDVLKLLLHEKKHDAALEWLKQHDRQSERVLLLDVMHRFKEAAELLQKLGPLNYHEFDGNGEPLLWTVKQQQKAHDSRLKHLLEYVPPAARPAPPVRVVNVAELEERYAYGEISKAEYEKLLAKEPSASAKLCSSCGQSVEPTHKFCPNCGAATESLPIMHQKPPIIKPPLKPTK